VPNQITHSDAQALQMVREALTTAEGRTYDHLASMFRWLLATLFTAHGGAILCILSDQSPIIPTASALGCFAAGLVLCLLMGIASTFGAIRVSTKLNRTRALTDQMLFDGVDRGVELKQQLDSFAPSWRSWVPSYFCIASLACLIAGMALVANNLNLSAAP
jgi:hypothetical protein